MLSGMFTLQATHKTILQYYNAWLADLTMHESTNRGNMKPLSCSLICEWVKFSWNTVLVDMVKGLFHSCVITTSMDGSGDCAIYIRTPAWC